MIQTVARKRNSSGTRHQHKVKAVTFAGETNGPSLCAPYCAILKKNELEIRLPTT